MLAIFVILVTLFWTILAFTRSWRHQPPGPWGFPVVGHLPLLGRHPAKTMLKWKKIYGPIIQLRFGSSPAFILSDAKTIREAFHLHAFDGRHQLDFLTDVSKGKGLVMAENENSDEQRQFTFKILKDFGLGREAMEVRIQQEICRLFQTFTNSSGEWLRGNGLYSISAVNSLWEIFFSEKLEQGDKRIMELSEIISHRLTKLESPFEKLTYFMPTLCRYFGKISGFNNRVNGSKVVYDFMKEKIDQRRATGWVKGQPENFTDAYLDKMALTVDKNSSFHPDNDNHTFTTGDLFIASIEAVGSTLDWLTVYLAKYPHVQQKLQAEVDQVVGHSRLPSLKDRPEMKYADAVVTELLRISTVTPVGAPRRTLVDIEFMGYKISKGTKVIGNQYAVNHDEDTWDKPHEFMPERFLPGPDGQLPRNRKAEVFAFGNGGRSCVGEALAKDQIFLYVTSVAQNFNIYMDPEEAKQIKVLFGITLNPSAFRVKYTSRII